jgi:hypothetical protein
MSIWYEIKDKEDVKLSEDGKTIDVNFTGDDNGNIYVEIPIEFLPSQFKQAEQSDAVEFAEWLQENAEDLSKQQLKGDWYYIGLQKILTREQRYLTTQELYTLFKDEQLKRK